RLMAADAAAPVRAEILEERVVQVERAGDVEGLRLAVRIAERQRVRFFVVRWRARRRSDGEDRNPDSDAEADYPWWHHGCPYLCTRVRRQDGSGPCPHVPSFRDSRASGEKGSVRLLMLRSETAGERRHLRFRNPCGELACA